MERLEKLFILSNNLREIDSEAFTGIPQLLWLALNNNLLTTLPHDVFEPVSKLQRMSVVLITFFKLSELFFYDFLYRQLDSNHFMFLPEGTLEPLKNLQYVNLIKNPWHCDCSILYLTRQ